jgi:transglutaminase-like putative cysteine protease
MPAVVIIGLLLIANMSLTTRDQLPFIVIFSIASLFLLVRFHTLDEQADWLRRRIGDPAAISTLYLRGGSVFIIVAISGSLLLTNAAASAPLAGAWTEVGARFIEWGAFLERFLPPSRTGRSLGTTFGPNARVGKSWNTDNSVARRVQLDPAETTAPYLLATVYDVFDLGGWTRSNDAAVGRDATSDLLAGTGDALPPNVLRPLTATITPDRSRREIFSPGLPGTVDQAVSVRLVGGAGFLHAVEREASNGPYTITALVPASEKDGGRTAARLRVAGTDYPAEIEALYGRATLPAGSIGPEARALLDEILAGAEGRNPYDVAIAIRDTLLDPDEFEYQTDVTDLRCDDPSIVECFVITRAGFCQWYASTMAVFLRDLGIPARFVQGYLPGTPDASGGGRTVHNFDAHAWVQVYFPGYGWEDFNPTGGPVEGLAPIPSGRPEASGTPGPSSSGGGALRDPTQRPEIDEPGGAGGGPIGGPRAGDVSLLIAFALVLAAVVGALVVAAWQRGPRGPVSADSVYGSIARFATRLGLGPRPNQTVYEYAGALAEQIPSVRPELETVATAKVEVAYGARVLGDDRLAGLRKAQRRLRLGLLRLAVRRTRRRR